MTLPEHAICSLMIPEIGVRNRFGTVGVVAVTATGISPDLDTAAKLVSDESFWRLHHALGHSLLFIVILTAVIAGAARRISELLQFRPIFGWCLLAAFVHCLTDSLYWWGVKPLWPFQSDELRFKMLDYLDLIVLAIWLGGAVVLWRDRDHSRRVASATLAVFTAYVFLRAALPQPEGVWKSITGHWMYDLPSGGIFDWW